MTSAIWMEMTCNTFGRKTWCMAGSRHQNSHAPHLKEEEELDTNENVKRVG